MKEDQPAESGKGANKLSLSTNASSKRQKPQQAFHFDVAATMAAVLEETRGKSPFREPHQI